MIGVDTCGQTHSVYDPDTKEVVTFYCDKEKGHDGMHADTSYSQVPYMMFWN